MPQMNPSLWLNLYVTVYIPLLFLSSYVMFTNKNNSNLDVSIKSKSTNMNWLW